MKKCIHKDKLILCNFQKMYQKAKAGPAVQKDPQQKGPQEDEGEGTYPEQNEEEGGGGLKEGLQQNDQEGPQSDEGEEEEGGCGPESLQQRNQEGLQADEGGWVSAEGPRLRRRRAMNYSHYF